MKSLRSSRSLVLLSWLGSLLGKTRGGRAWSQPAGWARGGQPFYIQLCFLYVAKRKRGEIGQAQGGGPGAQQTLHFLQITGETHCGIPWVLLGAVLEPWFVICDFE